MSGRSQDPPFEEPEAGGSPVQQGHHPERNVHDGATGQLPGPAGTPKNRDQSRPSPLPEHERDASPDRGADRGEPGTHAPAGPHSQPSLTNPDATPGAGTLPSTGDGGGGHDVDSDASTG